MGKVLFDNGLLTELDDTLLAMYCTSYAHWREANEAIDKYGAVMVQGSKKLKPSPWFAIANGSWKQMTWTLIEFGLTPSSRSRVSVTKKIPTTPGRRDWFGERKNTGDDDDWFGDHRN